ncbi:rRNA maturation RNase YbeY [Helicobacter anatolicus]|uniref:rRNA maturation RNase YbeY n=1 Tax=Helicobacter anatolicus TaxID=2905874 RepID=UPI001E46401A|nr:rRNA maturation RNase YbeY [Helicobacter anatolicus]MCE3038489.1 rRNA maturation RNase YbeY [Helicobacter anatolicus]
MLDIDNQTLVKLSNLEKLEKIALVVGQQKNIELLFVDEKTIQEINRLYRNQNKPTDVLSFPLDDMGVIDFLLGSIVICIPIAEKMAIKYGHTLEEEVALLFIHGILHLQGYDHEKDQGEHREAEKKWVEYFRLPSSLIVRTME